MKKFILIIATLFISISGFAQTINGFSEQITIDNKTYYVSDSYVCLDYRLIAEPDCFKSIIGKFPAYGVIDGSNNIVIPLVQECSGVMFKPEKGCILVLHSNKQLLNTKIGVYDFNGKEIIPVSIDMKNSFTNQDKKVWKQYDNLPADVKDGVMEVYKAKKDLFNAKMGR